MIKYALFMRTRHIFTFLLVLVAAFLQPILSHAGIQTDINGKLHVFTINGREFNDWSYSFDIRGPVECTAKAQELDKLVNDYQNDAYLNPSRKSVSRAQTKIQAVLDSMPESDPCYHWIHGFYAMHSVSSFGHFSNDQFISLFNIATELYYQERLIPITQKLRDHWGGIWTEQPNKILGAYQCEESIVYFDSKLPPYNLGSVLAHEFEHLVRDKFSYDSAHVDQFVRDPELTLLLDETLSTLQAGYTQLEWVRDNNRDHASATGRAIEIIHADRNGGISLFHHQHQRHFHLSGDLDLYSKRGKLNQIFNKI